MGYGVLEHGPIGVNVEAVAAGLTVGGPVTLGAGATQLSASTTPMASITIRSIPGNLRLYFGGSNVTNAVTYAQGYLDATEAFVYEGEGKSFRPCDIYLAGNAGDTVLWSGVTA